ncbi:MAG TPA: ATP-binding protein [Stackebrandtia sp.]|jgi:predicted AAA+ superfamily ATPase|uniref:ATP-binding protein n=1 Tax=Stackebrandtia sp. TaxID=2023065 RepID=UPI002D57284E|nr:ATP-binding protein [Stackebrandtia sp.]HZE40225.1 ATP-binding protein [Stackebrandtia sp.]
MNESPVVVLTGIRTVGKSTMLHACARHHGVDVTDLDDRATLAQVTADPGIFVAGRPEPVCIDEFQHAPDLLYAIKSELNHDFRFGRYLLTGSTRYTMLPRAAEALTGRAHIMTIWPLSQGELIGHRETFIDTVMTNPERLRERPTSGTTRDQYTHKILTGGMPIALSAPSDSARGRYFDDLVELIVLRDVLDIRRIRQRGVLQNLTRILAARTGQILNVADIANTLGQEARNLYDYVNLLESVFLVHRLEPFGRTLGARIAKSPKVHFVDSGLAAHLLGVNRRKLALRKSSTLSEFGHVVETFAVNEMLKQSGWSDTDVTFSHFRTHTQREVDLVMEARDGSVAGIEVKASGTVSDSDFAGLRLMRDKLGDDFVAGVVVNLGQRTYRYDDRLYVAAMDQLWQPNA